MTDEDRICSSRKTRWEFRKETVVNLRAKLHLVFEAAGWNDILGDSKANEVYSSFCEDDPIITNLAKETLQALLLEKRPDEELKKLLEAEMLTFLNPVLEKNSKIRKESCTYMTNMLEKLSGKYQRKLNKFMKITSSDMTDENILQSFHNETILSLMDEYDGAEKPGNIEFQDGYREQLLKKSEKKFSIALIDHRRKAEDAGKKIENSIQMHCKEYTKLLHEEARNILCSKDLRPISQKLNQAAIQKFKTQQSFLGFVQYSLAEMKLTEELFQAYHQILMETSTTITNFDKTCQHEFEVAVQIYKTGMVAAIKSKSICEDQIDLSVDHQNLFDSVLATFELKLAIKEDIAFTKLANIKACFKQKLEERLLDEFVSLEEKWESNRRMILLEVQEHLYSSNRIIKEELQKTIGTASKLDDIISVYNNQVAAAEARFYQRFPNLDENYLQQQWKKFLSTINEMFVPLCSQKTICNVTGRLFVDLMEAKYEKLMRKSVSQNPFAHGDQLKDFHGPVYNNLTCHLNQSNESSLIQDLFGIFKIEMDEKIQGVYQIIQKEQNTKVSIKIFEAEAIAGKLLKSHSSKILKMIFDGALTEELENFKRQESQQILQQYTDTISWAESTDGYPDLMREFEIVLNTAFEKVRMAIEKLEIFYNEYYGRADLSSENIMIPPEICQMVHENACSSAISRGIEENLLADEKVFKEEAKSFLDKKYQEKLADATVIGIDFGWNYCKSAVYVNGKIQMIPHYDESGEEFSSMASYVGVGDCDGLVGQYAKVNVENVSEFRHILWNLKWIYFRIPGDKNWWIRNYCTWKIGETQGTISVDGTTYLIATVVSKLFQKLKKNAEKFLNHSIKNCVVTVYYGLYEHGKCDIAKAVELAGFTGVTILEECGSAVLLYKHILDLQILKKKVLFLDFGLDFKHYALEVKETDYTMLTNNCYYYYCGGWIVHEIVEYCINVFCTLENVRKSDLNLDAKFNYQKQRIWIACEKAIKALSVTQTVKISVSNFYKGKEFYTEIPFVKMQEIINSGVTRTMRNIRSYISEAGLSLERIDEIIISGGFSRMPLFQKSLISLFSGRSLNNLHLDPDEVIARGAAIKGAMLAANFIRARKFKTN